MGSGVSRSIGQANPKGLIGGATEKAADAMGRVTDTV
jgi:hypothetical protein